MRQNKTSKDNRVTYTYYSAESTRITLVPGENGVTEAHIAMLHDADDSEFDANRREAHLTPVHYQSYPAGEAETLNKYLADSSLDPDAVFEASITAAEQRKLMNDIWRVLLPEQRCLVLKKLRGLTNVDIAAAEGVTEAAIRNRLKKIQEKIKKIR